MRYKAYIRRDIFRYIYPIGLAFTFKYFLIQNSLTAFQIDKADI